MFNSLLITQYRTYSKTIQNSTRHDKSREHVSNAHGNFQKFTFVYYKKKTQFFPFVGYFSMANLLLGIFCLFSCLNSTLIRRQAQAVLQWVLIGKK